MIFKHRPFSRINLVICAIQIAAFTLCLLVKVLTDNFLFQVKIPGSSIIFEPKIFVTVIVHTPFFTTPAQQVCTKNI